MSEAKFTKGQWVTDIDQHDEPNQDIVISSNHMNICKVHIDDCCTMHNKELKANAHLIAAAPQMYELLEVIMNILNGEDALSEVSSDDIAKLLTKARGEQ